MLSRDWEGNVGKVETLLLGKDGSESQLEKAVGKGYTGKLFLPYLGYPGTIDAVVSTLDPLGFVTNLKKCNNGSYDIKIETYL